MSTAFSHITLRLETEWHQRPARLSYCLDSFLIDRLKDEARAGKTNAAGEVVKPGRYLTKDIILEIYDALAESMQTGEAYQTRLDPPQGDSRDCHPALLPALSE